MRPMWKENKSQRPGKYLKIYVLAVVRACQLQTMFVNPHKRK